MKAHARLAATVCAAGLVGILTPGVAGATDDPVPPDAAVEAVVPGGSAYEKALELNTSESGELSGRSRASAQNSVTFGEDLRRSVLLVLAEEGPDHVVPTDYYERGDYWLAIEYVDGKPYSAMEVSSTGELLTLDGWLPEEVSAMAAAPTDATIATDGRYGEVYAITAEGSTALALNPTTADFIGGPSISVADLRGLKAAQEIARQDAEPDDVQPGAIGGVLGAEPPSGSSPVLWIGIAGAGVLLVGGAAYILGRTTRPRRES